MNKFYCNAFNFKSKTLKIIKDVLTTNEKEAIENKIKSPCGGFYLDGTVFKVDKKTNSITKKENDSVEKTIKPYCGGILLDDAVFELKDGFMDLKEVMTVAENIPMTKITFDSLDNFSLKLMNNENEVITPLSETESEKIYNVPKNAKYSYEANNGEKVVKRTIDTTKRNNINETITF